MTAASITPLLEVEGLHKHYPVRGGVWGRQTGSIQAVAGVSFRVLKGQTLGLVGESGCGKSTLGRTLMRLEEPTAGRVRFEGRDLAQARYNVLVGQLRLKQASGQLKPEDLQPINSLLAP